MHSEAVLAIAKLRKSFPIYAPRCLKIVTKSGSIVPFQLNKAQEYIEERAEAQLKERGYVRMVILKGRQQGASTYITGRLYYKATGATGKNVGILTHEQKATDNLFTMVRRYHEHCPALLKPSTAADSAKELWFNKRDVRYKISTAGAKGTGRSSTIQYFHGCLSPDTFILDGTSGALRRMADFAVGDMVRTHTGRSAPVSFISRQKKQAKKILMKGMRDFPLIATGEHRFWTLGGWKELSDIVAGDVLGFPVQEITESHEGWAYRLTDSFRPQGGGTREVGPDSICPTFDLGRILGLYLAEGCITKQSRTKEPSAVTFAVHENEVDRTVEWLKPMSHLFRSVNVTHRAASRTVTVTAYGRSFATFVRNLCGELDGKKLPASWSSCGRDFVRGLVIGYLSGDGHFSPKRDRRISATSIRSAISIGMRDAIASLGYGWASIEHKDAAIRNGRNEKEAFVLRLTGCGVDLLSTECDKPSVERKRNGNYGEIVVRGGYAWVPVASISDVGLVDVMDFEVGHEDHSYCTMHCATHNSEVAFWPNAASHMAGIGEAIPLAEGTEVYLESTANGIGNTFYNLWQDAVRGISDYEAVFIPWYWEDGYSVDPPKGFALDPDEAEYADAFGLSLGQMAWRRKKIIGNGGDVSLFNQEYPATPEMAFMAASKRALIPPTLVAEAARPKTIPAGGPLIIGVDPAEYGDDQTAIVVRHGRKVVEVQRHKLATMELCGHIAMMIDRLDPDAVCIDVTNSHSMADRLIEQHYRNIYKISFGSGAIKNDQYANKRAEMYGEMKAWLEDYPCEIPAHPVLMSDLSSVDYSYDSSRRMILASKEKMRSAGIPSPDMADALALTFAVPVMPKRERYEPWQERLHRTQRKARKNPQAA